jgi:hypothetical protein
MKSQFGLVAVALAFPLFLLGGPAWSGEGIQISITNDGTDDILVTVYDMSLGPNAVILSHQRINGFSTIPLSLSSDATGRANVSWTAVTVDPSGRKCGHAERTGLADSASVTVRADSACAAAAPSASTASIEE